MNSTQEKDVFKVLMEDESTSHKIKLSNKAKFLCLFAIVGSFMAIASLVNLHD